MRYDQLAKQLHIDTTKFEHYTENCFMEACIIEAEKELSGTFLESEEDNDGFIDRIADAIGKLLERFKEYIKGVMDTITNKFSAERLKLITDKVDEALAKNPKLRTENVQVYLFADQITKSELLMAKIKTSAFSSRITGKVSVETIEDYAEELQTIKNITDKKAQTIAIGGTANAMKNYVKKMNDEVDEARKSTEKFCYDAVKYIKKIKAIDKNAVNRMNRLTAVYIAAHEYVIRLSLMNCQEQLSTIMQYIKKA